MKLALVTGASTGIGRATVESFLSDGWEVHGVARRGCDVPGALSHAMDLVEEGAIAALCAELAPSLAAAERVCVVHNAAMMASDSAREIDAALWDRNLRLNVTVPALLTAGLMPHLGTGSSVVYIGSTLSEQAVGGRLSYVTSKHALVGLMRATVQDLMGSGIHAACVCPGFVDTDMLRPILDANPGLEEAVKGMVSFGRLIEPAEIAGVIRFVADNPVTNGAVLHANLGQRGA